MEWGDEAPELLRYELSYVPVKAEDWRRVQMAFIRGYRTMIDVSDRGRRFRGPALVTTLWPGSHRATYLVDSPDFRVTLE